MEGGGGRASRLPSSLAGRSGDTHRPARRGRVRPGPGERGARGASWCVSCRRRLALGLPPPACSPVYTPGCAPGAGGVCQGYLGVIRPSSAGQTPKDVVVGATAAWEGPWEWRRRRVGAIGHSRLWVSPGPPRGPLQVPQPLLTLPWSPCPSLSLSCGWTAGRGVGSTVSQGRARRQAATPTVGRGQEPNPEGGAGHALVHPADGSGRPARRGPTLARPVRQDGRGREPSAENRAPTVGLGRGQRPPRSGAATRQCGGDPGLALSQGRGRP